VQVAGRAGTQWVDVTVQPLQAPQALSGMVLVVFADALAPAATVPQPLVQDDRLGTLACEMQHVRDELRTTRDEMQASQEELKSSNEELQSTNEELQSANEELTTSKEEMQSMNEELQSLNRELTFKLGEMSQSSDDLKNLLNSTDIATLFLDEQMRVRRFTTQACGIFKLIASDVGRPITDLVTALNYADLARDAQEVLRTLVFKEVAVAGAGQRWFNVRIMPYRTQDNRIDGVVITFVDISTLKALEVTLQQALEALQAQGQTPDSRLQRAQSLLASASDAHARTSAPLPQGT
jgi:two-component system CheB/CheR fusion protein